jgi:NAD dependent epimerase/dehydratase family enzyme
MTEILTRHYKRKLWLPGIPASVVKILFGEVAESLLKGGRISAKKIVDADFNFTYKTISSIL